MSKRNALERGLPVNASAQTTNMSTAIPIRGQASLQRREPGKPFANRSLPAGVSRPVRPEFAESRWSEACPRMHQLRRRICRLQYRLRLPHGLLAIELAIQEARRADQRQMAQRLGRIAQVMAMNVELFGVKPQRIGITQQLFELQMRLFNPASPGQAFNVPE